MELILAFGFKVLDNLILGRSSPAGGGEHNTGRSDRTPLFDSRSIRDSGT